MNAPHANFKTTPFLILVSTLLLALISINTHAQSIAQQGRAFLKENSQREGVLTTDSGLQYMVITAGNEFRATKRDKVLVHYQGKHINGEVFDSTYGGKPSKFRLSRVIDGWTEGLQLIGEGGRIALFVPPELAYGRRGSRPSIAKNETLIFIIDLLEITSKR